MMKSTRGLGGMAALVLSVAVLALVAPESRAQTAQQGQAATNEDNFPASHLAKAQRVIDLTKSAEGFDDILPIVAEQTSALIIRNYPALTREVEEVTTEKAIELAATRAELNRTLQLIWARRFSEAELDELIVFFSSPVGQKFADTAAPIAALSVGASRQWGDRLATEMLTAVREELRSRGHQL